MNAIQENSKTSKVAPLCSALGIPRASFYREEQKKSGPSTSLPKKKVPHPRSLTPQETEKVLETLNSERFCDQSPREIVPTLLDEGVYFCSPETMYRILRQNDQVKERRNQLAHPIYHKPELLATKPNEVWSWDITKLLGPAKWTYYYLYVIIDIFSRYVVGWMVSYRESAELAKRFISETCAKQNINPGQLTIHADRGTSMTSKPVAFLLADLGVTKTHSRPQVSNDNPFSESQFKTMKYRPDFPDRFQSYLEARNFCQSFFNWYNEEHHHSGICYLTPEDLHFDKAEIVIKKRQETLDEAYRAHPERFVRNPPIHSLVPKAVWINPPKIPTPEGGAQ